MIPTLFRVILPVSDIDRAARFYETILDAGGERVSPGRHYFDCGGTILACYDPRCDGDEYDPQPNTEFIYFSTEDLEASFRACTNAGATFQAGDVDGTPAGEIATRPWGERSFYIADPFGNRICFVDSTTKFVGLQ